jgi:transcriptional regulator with XRE-family HTH domain
MSLSQCEYIDRTGSSEKRDETGTGRGHTAVNLRRLRHKKGLAQDDLAYEAEVSRSYLSQLEKGSFYASLRILEKLGKALGVEAYELIVPPKKRR